jgi:hypothetical protein
LTAVAVTNGVDNPKDYLADMLLTESSRKISTTYSQVSDPAKTASANANAGKRLENFELFHNDLLQNPMQTFALNDPKYGSLLKGVVGAVGPMILPDGSSVPMATIGQIKGTALSQILDMSKIYFGENKVGLENLNNVVFDGGDMAKVYLPTNNDGSVALNSLKDFQEVSKRFETNKNVWSAQQAKDEFRKAGFSVQISEEPNTAGKIVKVIKESRNIKPFAAVPAYTNDGDAAASLVA